MQAPANSQRSVPDIPSGEGLIVGQVVYPGAETNLADLFDILGK